MSLHSLGGRTEKGRERESEDENCENEDCSTGLLYLLHHACLSVLTELNTLEKVALIITKSQADAEQPDPQQDCHETTVHSVYYVR